MDPQQQQMIQALMAQQSPGSMGQMQSTGMGAPPWKNPTSSMQPMGDQMQHAMGNQQMMPNTAGPMGGLMGNQAMPPPSMMNHPPPPPTPPIPQQGSMPF